MCGISMKIVRACRETALASSLKFNREHHIYTPSTNGDTPELDMFTVHSKELQVTGYMQPRPQMQLTAGWHLIMELKAAGWMGIKQMINHDMANWPYGGRGLGRRTAYYGQRNTMHAGHWCGL